MVSEVLVIKVTDVDCLCAVLGKLMSRSPSYSQGRVYAWGFGSDVSEMMASFRDTAAIVAVGDCQYMSELPVIITTFPWARGPLDTGPTCLIGGTSSKVSSSTTAGATCLPMAWSRCFAFSAISTLVLNGNVFLTKWGAEMYLEVIIKGRQWIDL